MTTTQGTPTTTGHAWTADGHDRFYRETGDPRILEVIERDTDSQGPYGDALAPAYRLEYRNGWSVDRAGETFEDDDMAEAYVRARNACPQTSATRRLGNSSVNSDVYAARYMRIFHDTTVAEVQGQNGTVLLLNTPAYRTHVEIEDADGNRALNGAGTPVADEIAYSLEGEISEFTAWLDGDVWGIGHAVKTGRVTDEMGVLEIGDGYDAADDLDEAGWNVEIEVWGHFGEEYAKETLSELEAPALEPMLDFSTIDETTEAAK